MKARGEMTVKRLFVSLLAIAVAVTLMTAGCSQSVASAPTQAPAKAAEPTKAPASPAAAPAAPTKAPEPTTVPAKKVNFPEKGRAITFLVAYPAGGDTDLSARLLAPLMEKDLGVPVNVVNKGGAGGQVGMTEIAQAKPDGYLFGYTPVPSGITMYLDPERKAVFNRQSFAPLANHALEPDIIGVKADSPYKTVKDLVDAAKANPDKITIGFTGQLSHQHLAVLELQRVTGAKFAIVSFDGSGPAQTALLGGHISAQVASAPLFLPQVKSGEVRLLGIMDKQESPFLPEVKTLESQGYPVYMATARILSAPAGTPKEIVDILSGSIKKAMDSDEHKKKAAEVALSLNYMSPADTEKFWAQMEEQVKPLMELALAK